MALVLGIFLCINAKRAGRKLTIGTIGYDTSP